MQDTGLVRYDAMCHAIVTAYDVDEVKDIRDRAISLEHYAQQAMNVEAERKACEIRLRAERRAGELLKEKERAPVPNQTGKNKYEVTGQREPQPQSEYAEAKAEAGISDTQAKRWQKLADVPEKEFESALKDPEKKPSTAGIINIRKANGERTPMHPDALWVWGRLRDFEQKKITPEMSSKLLNEMTETQIIDVKRIAPFVRDFLEALINES